MSANWVHAGRCIRNVTHDVNNQLGAILAYAELFALDAGAGSPADQMTREILAAVQRSSVLLDTLAAIVGRDESTVETINVGETLENVALLFHRDFDRLHVRFSQDIPSGVHVFPGVYTRIVRMLVHSIRHTLDRLAKSEDERALRIELEAGGREFILRFIGAAASGEIGGDDSGGEDSLQEAREHAEYHRGKLIWSPSEGVTVSIPRDTQLIGSDR